MTIDLRPLTEHDANHSEIIDLYREAFPKVQRLPKWVIRYRLKKGKAGFNAVYDHDTWVGFVYTKEYKDVVCVLFLAISDSCRSGGYGSKVLDSMGDRHRGKRLVLNIEEIDKQADNYPQRLKRKAFYEKNGFISTGFIVLEFGERQEMLIRGGSISKEEVEAMNKYFMGHILSFFLKPDIIKIK